MSNNSLHDGYSAARTLASSIPDSADFALVISFGMGLNKERATEEILEVFIARSYEARTITIEAERTSVILIGNGIFDKKMRKSDPSNIYNGIKNILGRYVDNGLINVQVYLGEKKNQKVTIVAKGWWDSYLDNYVTYTYQGPNFYCSVIVWGFYTD